MRPSSLLSIFLIAAPSLAIPTFLSPRKCVSDPSTYQGSISKLEPNSPSTNGQRFLVWKDTNGTVLESLIQFTNIPTGAWGCQLELIFSKGYPYLTGMYNGNHQLYVYRVTETIQSGASWDSAPKPTYLFGNTPGELLVNQPIQNDMKIIINSATCAPTMGFRVALPPEAAKGGVYFQTDDTWKNVGFRMTYC